MSRRDSHGPPEPDPQCGIPQFCSMGFQWVGTGSRERGNPENLRQAPVPEKGGVWGGGRELTPLAPADLAQLGRPLVLPRAKEVVGVLQAAREDLAHVAAVAVGAQLLVAVGQHLRHGRVRGLRGGASSARVPARGGQGQRRWGRERPARDSPGAAAAAGAPASRRGTPLGQEGAAHPSDPASAHRRAALRSGSARKGLLLWQGPAGLTSSARSGAGRGPGRAGPRGGRGRAVPASPEGAGPGGHTPRSRRAGPAASAGGCSAGSERLTGELRAAGRRGAEREGEEGGGRAGGGWVPGEGVREQPRERRG